MTNAGRAFAAVAASLWLLGLAACAPVPAPVQEAEPPAPAPAEVAAPRAAPLPPRPPRKPPVPPTVEAAVPALPEPPAPPPERPPGDFERLNGLGQPATLAWLGEPNQRAESPPATIWRYITSDCELDVYFYLDLRTNEMRALHYEVRNSGHDAADRPQDRCYQQLIEDRGRIEPAAGSDHPR